MFGCTTDISHFKWAASEQLRSRLQAEEAKRNQENFIEYVSPHANDLRFVNSGSQKQTGADAIESLRRDPNLLPLGASMYCLQPVHTDKQKHDLSRNAKCKFELHSNLVFLAAFHELSVSDVLLTLASERHAHVW